MARSDERISQIGIESGKVSHRSVQEFALIFLDNHIASGSLAQSVEHLTFTQSVAMKTQLITVKEHCLSRRRAEDKTTGTR